VVCALSACRQVSQITGEEADTQEVLTTSQTPINTTQAVETELPTSAQHTVVTTTEGPTPTLCRLTAYCPCHDCCHYKKADGTWNCGGEGSEKCKELVANPKTSRGVRATAGRTVAVDPSVIPYGSEVVIYGHTYIAEDCGGAVNGYEVDIFFNSHQEALDFGVQYAKVEVK
jgi:3D (Asp-Asp-Asp) domain-containing protein